MNISIQHVMIRLALAAALACAPLAHAQKPAPPAPEAPAAEGGAEAAAEAAADHAPAAPSGAAPGGEVPAGEAPAAEAPPASAAPAEPAQPDPDSERAAVEMAPDSTPATPSPEPAAASPSPSPSAAAPEPLPPDVPEKHWAAGAVRRSLKRGMLELHGGKFAGSQTATRRDLAMVVGGILAAAGKTGPATPAKDLDKNDPAAKAIALAAGSGAIKLHKGNRLSGHQPITREDLARSMSKLLAVVRNESEGPVSDPVELNDLPPDSNLFNPVQRVLKAKIISLINLKYEGYLPVPRFALASVASKVLDAIKK